MRTKKTSTPLTELRTVMTRAGTAFHSLANWPAGGKHTPHEIELIKRALKNAHDELYRIEQLTGYEGSND